MGRLLLVLAVALLATLVVASKKEATPVSSSQSSFESRKTLGSNHGPLKPATISQHGPAAVQVTRVSPIPQHSSPPLVPISITPTMNATVTNSTTNGTSTNHTVQLELCVDCISFMNNNLNTLIAIVTKIGITDTCDKICGMLNSSVDIAACNVMCDAIGSTTFWHMFVSAGINPIYACELVNACTAGTHPAVNFSVSTITPPNGPQGTTFDFKVPFTVVNDTGVGEYAFVIYYPTVNDHEVGFISQQVFTDYIPGDYVATLSFPTNSSFNTGKYLVLFDLCSGACGQDPSPYPFAEEELAFNLTSASEL